MSTAYDDWKGSPPMQEPDDASVDAERICMGAKRDVVGIKDVDASVVDGRLDYLWLSVDCDVEDGPEVLEAFASKWRAAQQGNTL